MTKKPKKSNTRTTIRIYKKYIKVINTLHKHLPDEFPLVELIDYPKRIIGINRSIPHVITVNGEMTEFTPPVETSTEVHDVLLMFRFLDQYSKDKYASLWISGLPWSFNGKEFYIRYAKELGPEITEDMLTKLGFDDKETLKKYRRLFKDIIKKSSFEIFQEQILENLESKNAASIKIEVILKELKSDVTIPEIKKWYKKKLFMRKIEIDFNKGYIRIDEKR